MMRASSGGVGMDLMASGVGAGTGTGLMLDDGGVGTGGVVDGGNGGDVGDGGVIEYTRRVALLRVREYQRPVYESGARFKLLLCGRRWGKTTVGLAAAGQGHGPEMGSEGHLRGAMDGARIGWIAPSDDHPSAAEVWKDLKRGYGPLAVSISEQQRRMELTGGGSITVWSGYDPDGLRGTYFDGVVVDECSLQREGVWVALRPTLSDYGGWGLLLGTVPQDVASHWFAQLHRAAETEGWRERGWATWRRPSWENPQLTAGDLEEAKETLGVRTYL
ncbi:MAG TPA: hypothetical protein VNM48_09625 [Chloroflexota bacterium]|nr:hypothetical protein [Chloroflexota bacterium]